MAADPRTEVAIDIAAGAEPAGRPRPDTPFCMLVVGEFGGAKGRRPLRERTAIPFDRDDVDAAVARVRPSITLAPDGAPSFDLGFASLDDFHPDRLYVEVPLFASLRDLRTRLSSPRTFGAAARELTGDVADVADRAPAADAASGSLIDRMLAASEPAPGTLPGPGPASAAPAARAASNDLAAFIRQVVRPHVVAGPDPRQAELVAGVDSAVAETMRKLLRDPAFQKLESVWRTVDRLARRIETGPSLRLYLLDLADAELDTTLADEGDDGLRGALVRTAAALPDDSRWSTIVFTRAFGASDADCTRLGRLAAIGRALGSPILADADPALAGLATWADLPDPRSWTPPDGPAVAALRADPAAAWLCLAAPRVLLRAPYGDDGEPVNAIPFEEAADEPGHDAFLWGSAAAVCALLLARGFSRHGWRMRPGVAPELDRVPIHVRRRDGDTTILPGAETLMTDNAADRLMALGITPIATMRDSGTVRVVRFQSFADPGTSLAGPWSDA